MWVSAVLQHLACPAPGGAAGRDDLLLSCPTQRFPRLQVSVLREKKAPTDTSGFGFAGEACSGETMKRSVLTFQWGSRADRRGHGPGLRRGRNGLRHGPHLLQPQVSPHPTVQLQHLPGDHRQDRLLGTRGTHTNTHAVTLQSVDFIYPFIYV